MKKFKYFTNTIALILIIIPFSGHAESRPKINTIEQFVKELSFDYTTRALGKFDATHPHTGNIKISIENSLGEDTDKDKFTLKEFKNFTDGELWLRTRERGDGPVRSLKPLLGCSKGVCSYNVKGLMHNHLYLKKITYAYRNGVPQVKTIFLLDGD